MRQRTVHLAHVELQQHLVLQSVVSRMVWLRSRRQSLRAKTYSFRFAMPPAKDLLNLSVVSGAIMFSVDAHVRLALLTLLLNE